MIKIHVRRRHIVKGKRGDSRACPIALACTEAMKDVVRVGYSSAWIRGAVARRLWKPVKPFAFVLK